MGKIQEAADRELNVIMHAIEMGETEKRMKEIILNSFNQIARAQREDMRDFLNRNAPIQ